MMVVFFVLAVLLCVATGIYLARPLWRDGARASAVALVVAVLVGSALFYATTSRWSWPQLDAASSPAAMVSRLARRLEREPEDVDGWLMLGRSQIALGQYPLAIRAFQRADRLEGGRNADAVLGMAEAMMSQTDNVLDERSGRLFERALELAPDSGRALFFSAIAAQNRGDTATAVQRFERLLASDPPPEVRSIIEAQITAWGGAVAARAPTEEATAAAIRVAVSIAPALSAQVKPGSTLFVFVRAAGRPGPPLAAKRLPAVLPASVTLTAADSMMPGVAFAVGDEVEVSAKISADGSATPKAGEPIGRTRHTVGGDGTVTLVIDGLSP